MNQRTPKQRQQRGTTLVEILVTVVVISVGLLGVAALHTLSLRNGQYAHSRSQATSFANDIIDRMRANRDVAVTTTAYVIAIGTAAKTTPTTLAEQDLKAWKDALKQALPSGDGSVAQRTIAGEPVVDIVVQWGEHENTLNFTTTAAL